MIRYSFGIFVLFAAGFAFVNPALPYAPQTAESAGGNILKWHSHEIVVSISESMMQGQFESVSRKELIGIIRSSFEKWSEEAGLRIRFRTVKNSDISPHGSGGDGISLITASATTANLLLFGEGKTNQSAVTRLFFDDRGNITEADIVLNPTARFTSDGSRGSFDISSTLTHEAGHFLGLGHSRIVSATMHKHLGTNGTFSLPATYAATLSEDDKAGIRELYAPKSNHSFGSLRGRVVKEEFERELSGTHILLETKESGNVIAGIETDKDGAFFLGSIPTGNYAVYATDRNGVVLARSKREVRVRSAKEGNIELQTGKRASDLRVSSFGFNSQISRVAVPLETGHAYTIYMQSKNLDPERFRIESSSPGISVDSKSLTLQYKRGGQYVHSFEVFVSGGTPKGDYSLRFYDNDELVSNFPGILTVDDVINPWYSSLF